MHSLTDSNSRLEISSISDTSQLDARSAESSVDKSSLHLTAAFISLTDIKNIRGPRIEPCFTPHVTVLNSERHLRFPLFVIYPLGMNHTISMPLRLRPSLLIWKLEFGGLTVSNAFLRSNMTIPMCIDSCLDFFKM